MPSLPPDHALTPPQLAEPGRARARLAGQPAAGNATAQPTQPTLRPAQPTEAEALLRPDTPLDSLRDPVPPQAAPTARADPASHPGLARQIAAQITEAAARLSSRPTEIQLDPVELGRVRMTMVQTDTSISVSILADRGETLDLLRRHIALLSTEFKQIGYDDISFDFGHGAQRDSDGTAEVATKPIDPEEPDRPPASGHPDPAARQQSATAELDIRL